MRIPFLGDRGRHDSGKGNEKFVPSENEVAIIEKCTIPGTEMPDLDSMFKEAGITQEHAPHLREIISAKRYENVLRGTERHA